MFYIVCFSLFCSAIVVLFLWRVVVNYAEASWKRPDTGERVSGMGYDREDVFRPVELQQQESEPSFPKPAEGKIQPWMCLNLLDRDLNSMYIVLKPKTSKRNRRNNWNETKSLKPAKLITMIESYLQSASLSDILVNLECSG